MLLAVSALAQMWGLVMERVNLVVILSVYNKV